MSSKSSRAGVARSRNEKSRLHTSVSAKSRVPRDQLPRYNKRKRERMFAEADKLMSLGLRLIPTETRGKRPVKGLSFHEATTSIQTFREQAEGCRTFGIGVALGVESGLVIVDFDQPGAGRRRKEFEAKVGALPKTVRSRTGGGGYHWFFRAPKEALLKRNIKGLDLLGEGSMAILPPSIGVTGEGYRWVNGCGPDEIEIAELPPALERFWRKSESKQTAHDRPVGAIAEGTRNTQLTSIAGTMIQKGLSGKRLNQALWRENQKQCVPPLDRAEVEGIARKIEKASVPADIDPVVRAMKVTLDRCFAGGKHLMRLPDGKFWRYRQGVWEILSELELQQLIAKASVAIPIRTKPTVLVADVVTMLTAQRYRGDDPLAFTRAPPRIINFRNGELHLRGRGKHRFKKHSPESGLRHQLPFDYDANATAKLFDKTLAEIFRDAKDPEQVIQFIEEVIGYVVSQDRTRDVFFIFHGRGANGKSLLIEILVALLGQDLVHFAPVESLEQRFAFAGLMGKLAFVDDDVKTGVKLPDGLLKKLTGEKRHTVDIKYGPSMTFVARVVVFMLANTLPSLNDISNGLLRRLKVVHFGRVFEEHEQDLMLAKRIIETELPGIMNHALQGWDRLERNGKFTEGPDVLKAQRDMVRQANPVMTFLAEACIRDPKAKTLMKDLFGGFREWSAQQGQFPVNQKVFSQTLVHAGIKSVRHGSGVKVTGLRLK
jgi:P4 family phage/plasmid primase-like protien